MRSHIASWHIASWVPVALTAAVVAAGTAGAQADGRRAGHQEEDTASVVTITREVFQYRATGRRDPFASLLTSSAIRPTIADLRLTTIAYDPSRRNSVAVLRDLGTKEQYRVQVGSSLGRMRVVRIDPKAVTFALEEFGYSRQETLSMSDSTRTRTP